MTSMSDTSATFETEVYADNLRGLMLEAVAALGKLNRRAVSRHFSVTFTQQPKKETHRESVPILEGRALEGAEPRATETQPIDEGLML